MALDKQYWTERYAQGSTGWDVGGISDPLRAYFDQLRRKSISILIPGCGNAYEAEYLFYHGFPNVHLLDWSEAALDNFSARVPGFRKTNLINKDFFKHSGQYDLIIEQTFFCALDPDKRPQYAEHVRSLLKPGGKLVGVLFDDDTFPQPGPPFGGKLADYEPIFKPHFNILVMERCYNSIKPREGRELFIMLEKPQTP